MSHIESKLEQLNEVSRFIILLLRSLGYAPIPGELWLEKELFLLKNVFPNLADETDFEPYLMGPHSEIVDDELKELKNSDIVRSDGHVLKLTNTGKKISEHLAENTNKKELKKIDEFKELLNDLTKEELLAFVYFSYDFPEDLAKESIEFNSLVPKRESLAKALFEKDKISAQKAAQIAGIPLEDFISNSSVTRWNYLTQLLW